MKHKLLSTVAGLFSFSALFAQLPVSQSAENKNVVLEEFTGIYCGYCPDGHKRAQDIKDGYPSDVVLINIHAGSYANPSGGDPDFRTPWGASLVSQSYSGGGFGFPAGTVNRHVFPGREMANGGGTAMSRGYWAFSASEVLAESSYANVALEGTIDVASREMVVDVEVYYTGDGSATNKLNVALLQSGIEGPQSGKSYNPGQVLPNGNYQHNHMLRHLLTGQWGEEITTTSQGTLIERQYTYTIPNDLNGIDYVLEDLEIVAFLAEDKQEVITGAEGRLWVGTAGVENQANSVLKTNVYPNPANNVLNVDFELNTQEEVNVSIISTMGQVVSSVDLGSVSGVQSTQLDISSLESGMYIVKVKTTNGEQTKRMSVLK